MGLGSFVDINIFVKKYYIIWFLQIFHFFEALQLKSTEMLRPRNGNSGVSFIDTLLNFGLCYSISTLLGCYLILSFNSIET